jgi:hypothetical protein
MRWYNDRRSFPMTYEFEDAYLLALKRILRMVLARPQRTVGARSDQGLQSRVAPPI